MFRNGPHGGLETLVPGRWEHWESNQEGLLGFPSARVSGSMTGLIIFPSLEAGLAPQSVNQSGEDPYISGWTLSLSPGGFLKSEVPSL